MKWRIIGIGVVVVGLAAGGFLLLKARDASTTTTNDATTARSLPSADEAALSGYAANLGEEVVFLQWTKAGSALTGSAQVDTLTRKDGHPPFVESRSVPFTGVLSGGSISLQLGGTTWNGTHNGDDVVLSFADSTGALRTAQFKRATIADYQVIVEALQRKAADEASAQLAAQDQAAEDARQAKLREAEATRLQAEATLTKFRVTCRNHGGSLTTESPTEFGYELPPPNSADEYCVISPAGQGRLQVPIKRDGTFYQEAANENRDQCASNKEDARIAGEDGHPWKRQPEYHADAGACYRGDPYG